MEVRFANQYPMRTSIARKTLDPVWNESFRLEVTDDAHLQNEPLEFRVVDYDSITANDLIGSVYVDLNSLLTNEFEIDSPLSYPSFGSSDNDAESNGNEVAEDAVGGGTGQSIISSVTSNSSGDTSSHEGYLGETADVPSTYTRTLGGWFPIYDTMVGTRGELQCQIILQYFGDVNPFNNSSAGINVFSVPSPNLPPSVPIQTLGFISSIVTHIDPEYHWTDTFRTPRASNEARVRILHKITGLLRRRMGRKALEYGANAIVGYLQWFDFEIEEKIITGRAVGTAIHIGSTYEQQQIQKIDENALYEQPGLVVSTQHLTIPADNSEHHELMSSRSAPEHTIAASSNGHPNELIAPLPNRRTSTISKTSKHPLTSISPDHPAEDKDHRDHKRTSIRSSSERSTRSTNSSISTNSLQSADNARNQKSVAACEILTSKSFAPGVIQRIGGLVSATSVKLIENDQSRTRELWFDDLRAEIKHHALATGCTYIIGYTEQVSIRDEITILVVYGTAAVLNFDIGSSSDSTGHRQMSMAVAGPAFKGAKKKKSFAMTGDQELLSAEQEQQRDRSYPLGCRMCHASHNRQKLPFPMRFFRCGYCQKKAVPEILLTTIDLPSELDVVDGETCMIEAHICRPGSKSAPAPTTATAAATATTDAGSSSLESSIDLKQLLGFGKSRDDGNVAASSENKLSGEAYAAHISDALPFIHYDLHRQLLYKLSVHGMNAIFGLKYQFSVGEDMIIAVATGTAVYVTGLPTPGPLHIKRNIEVLDDEDRAFIRIQDHIMKLSNGNRRRLDHAFRKKRRAMIRLREQQRGNNNNGTRARSTSRDSRRSRSKRRGHHHSNDSSTNGHTRKVSTTTAISDSDASSESSSSSRSRRETAARRQRKLRARVAVQIDDDADEDLMAALLDIPLPPSFSLCNVERPPLFRRFINSSTSIDNNEDMLPLSDTSSSSSSDSESTDGSSSTSTDSDDTISLRRLAMREMKPEQVQTLVMVKRATVDPYGKHPNRQLAELFNCVYLELYTNLTYFARCAILGVDYKIEVVPEAPRDVQIVLSATVVGECLELLPRYAINTHFAVPPSLSPSEENDNTSPVAAGNRQQSHDYEQAIELTTLSYLPQRQITAHVGRISLHFVQEVHIDSVSKGPVGMGAFVFSFIAEVQAVARAHTAARGGMALIALTIDQVQILRDDRNQAYATISVSGDVVRFKKC